MRILMTVSSTSLMDGIGRHILAMAPALNAISGVEVAVMTLWAKGELNAALEEKGVKTYSLNSPHGHFLPAFWRTVHVMRAFNPDIVHVQVLPFFSALAFKLFYRKNKRFVLTRHGISDPVQNPPLAHRLAGFFFRFSGFLYDAVVYVSRGVMDFWGKVKPETMKLRTCIYNPIDFCSAGHPISKTVQSVLGLPSDVSVVGTACRFARVKNLPMFVSVVSRVMESNPKVHAVIFGDGDSLVKTEIESAIAALSPSIRVRFHLPGYRSDVAELVRSFSCYVMTSIREGMPTALLEAMAAKTPIAFFEGEGGLVDLIHYNRLEGPFAATAPAGAVEKLASEISLLLYDGERRERFVARALVVGQKHFTLDRAVEQLLSVYCHL